MSPRIKGMNNNINEIIISKKLKNKNIITNYGFCDIKKNEIDCIIMEYAKYGCIIDFQTTDFKTDNPASCYSPRYSKHSKF